MRAPKVTVNDFAELRTDLRYGRIEINFGLSFLYKPKWGRLFQLNRTPRSDDPTLFPVTAVSNDPGSLQIGILQNENSKSYVIHHDECPFGECVASFLASYLLNPLDLDPSYTDNWELNWEPGQFHLTLSQQSMESISFFFPHRRASHVYRRDDQLLQTDLLSDVTLVFNGSNLVLSGRMDDSHVEKSIEWRLNFQPELLKLATQVIEICCKLSNSESPHVEFEQTNSEKQADPEFENCELEPTTTENGVLGSYEFDSEAKCFLDFAAVVLYLTKVEHNRYRSVCYFYDGHEIFLNNDEVQYFSGNFEEVQLLAIRAFSRETYLSYPVVYPNLSCNLYEEEEP